MSNSSISFSFSILFLFIALQLGNGNASHIDITKQGQHMKRKVLASSRDVLARSRNVLTISRASAAPDCYQMDNLLLVNGSFTGPTITVSENDQLELIINNLLNESISIHIHGIFQKGSNQMDGASFISSKPIEPMQSTLIQTIITKQSGTYMYHAHLGLLDLHVFGAFIVKSAKVNEQKLFGYDEERVLLFSDYWRSDPDILLDGLVNAQKFQFLGSPESFLTNGKTIGENCTVSTPSYDVTSVDRGKSYRFRLIGATTLFPIHFSIPHHKLTIVEVEGTMVKPIPVDFVEILPGQRYSVIVKADQVPGQYWMQQQGKWRRNAPTNGFSILRYNQIAPSLIPPSIVDTLESFLTPPLLSPTPFLTPPLLSPTPFLTPPLLSPNPFLTPPLLSPTPLSKPPSILPTRNETFGWINHLFEPLFPQLEMEFPTSASATLVLIGKQTTWNPSTQVRWTVNNISYIFPQGKTILEHVLDGTLDTLPLESKPYIFEKNQVVDIVFQNTVALNGVCEIHPWHIHGHGFWHIESGPGLFSTTPHTSLRPFPSPIHRDTVSLYPSSHSYTQQSGIPGVPCGWTRVRVMMDNPGAWALHCHIASHFAMGMGTVFVVDPKEVKTIYSKLVMTSWSSKSTGNCLGLVTLIFLIFEF